MKLKKTEEDEEGQETGEIEGQFITYDLECSEGVQSVQLLAPGDTSAPHDCSLYCSSQPKYEYELVRNFELRPDKGRWQTFRIYFPGRARYWKLVMHNNHGSTTNMSLHACLFVRAQGGKLQYTFFLPFFSPTKTTMASNVLS